MPPAKKRLSDFPQIARQLDPELNGGVTADQIIAWSHSKFTWRCHEGPDHVWQATVKSRTSGGRGCPCCAGKRVSMTNSLAMLHPKIAEQLDPELNDGVTADQILAGTETKYTWRCPKGPDHVWRTTASSRTSGGRGCPFCAGRQISVNNSLASLFPDVAAQLDSELNDGVTADQIVAGSHTKYTWRCPSGPDHVWRATVSHRTRDQGCPCCARKRVSMSNSLATLYPKIAIQLDPELNGGVTADQIIAGSGKTFTWRCLAGADHVWQATASSRTLSGANCPCCTGRQISMTNSLASLFPDVAAQLDPELNGGVTADQIIAGSHAKFTWRCLGGADHVWKATVKNRTSSGSGCPRCNFRRSQAEIRIMCELASVFSEVEIDIDPSNEFKIGRWSFDGAATQLQLLIEYDGAYYHHNDSECGSKKAAAARLAGWTLIRLRGVSKEYVAPIEHFLDIAVDETESEYVTTLRLLERLVEISDPSFRLAEGAAIKAHRTELLRALDLYVEAGGPIASERADALIEERMRKTSVPVDQPLFALADQAFGPLVRPSEVAA